MAERSKRISSPEGRAAEIDKQRKSARRSFKGRKAPPKGKDRFIGEREFRMKMAVILSVAGYTPTQIANSLGESKSTINNWKKDPGFQEEYTLVTQTLASSALSLLQSYTIEAVQAVVMILRTSEDDKTILEAAKEIFDRGGLPKSSRAEVAPVPPTPSKTGESEFEKMFRELPPEKQEEYLKQREEMETKLQAMLKSSDGEGGNDETAG